MRPLRGGYPAEVAAYYGRDREGMKVEDRVTWKWYVTNFRAECEPESEMPGLPAETTDVFSGARDDSRDALFVASGEWLRALAECGDVDAQSELDRRAAKRAARRNERMGIAT